MLRTSQILLTVLVACGGKDKTCESGFALGSDGNCYPVGGEDEEVQWVSIGPDGIRTQDTMYSTVVISGAEVDTGLSFAEYPVRYRWYVDGVEATGTASHLHGWKYFDKGQAVSLLVEPLDDGPGLWSNTIVVANTPPPAPGIDVYPEEPYAGVDSLRCAVRGIGDFDADDITYKIEWTRNGEAWAASPPPPMDDGGDPPDWDTGDLPPQPPPDPSEVPASVPRSGELWTCHVSAFDGEDWSPTVTKQVTIRGEFSGWDGNTFELSESDYVFLGENVGDAAGASLSMVGDVDADGLGDFVIPAYFNDESAEDAGKVYLVRGKDLSDGPGTYQLADLPIAFTGQDPTEEAGHATGPADDVDGDGLDDFLICGYRNDNPLTDVGRVYLILGSSLDVPGTRSTSEASITFIGEDENNRLGHALGSAGDMDGDGLPEILMGSYGYAELGFDSGKTYIVPGSTLVPGEDVAMGTDQYMFLGEAEEDASGHALRAAGDVDGDGLKDMVIGARRNDTGVFDGGKGYVILGGSLGAIGSVQSLADADYGYYGEVEEGWVGYQATGAGDVDGDGLDDIMFGAHYSDYQRGRVYLIYGSSLSEPLRSAEEADVQFQGQMWSDQAGRSLAPAGDVDADGQADILIGARNARDRIGRAYLIFGTTVDFGIFDLSDSDVRFLGEAKPDEAGYTVSSAGDVNGDGLDDILIGAWQGDFDGDSSGAGKAYLNLAPSE